jgi:uncharacterized protein (TIGR02444 family)
MRLWDRVLGAYDLAEVAERVLKLQDEHGQCCSYLLWAAWAGEEGRPLEPALTEKAAALARHWEIQALQPLRAARRGLKALARPIPDITRESLRARVKGEELDAERLLVEALEGMAGKPRTQSPDVPAALRAAVAAWGEPAPDEALEALAAAFSKTSGSAKPQAEMPFNDDPAADQMAVKAKIAELRHAHQQLGDMVVELEAAPMPDQLQIARLKRQKLALRDQITRMEDGLTPDIIA